MDIKKNQTVAINSSLEFSLDASSTLNIKGDLEENDTDKDYNESIADDDRWFQSSLHADDKLENGGAIKSTLIQVGSLNVNVPKSVTQTFSSGGTKIRVLIKVERLTKNSWPNSIDSK